jgi:hypothetical protein
LPLMKADQQQMIFSKQMPPNPGGIFVSVNG